MTDSNFSTPNNQHSDHSVKSYYDEKFNRLNERTKTALRNIELECDYIKEIHDVYEKNMQDKDCL